MGGWPSEKLGIISSEISGGSSDVTRTGKWHRRSAVCAVLRLCLWLCVSCQLSVAMNVAFASLNSSQLRPLHWGGLELKSSSRCSKSERVQSLPAAEITDFVPRYFGFPENR